MEPSPKRRKVDTRVVDGDEPGKLHELDDVIPGVFNDVTKDVIFSYLTLFDLLGALCLVGKDMSFLVDFHIKESSHPNYDRPFLIKIDSFIYMPLLRFMEKNRQGLVLFVTPSCSIESWNCFEDFLSVNRWEEKWLLVVGLRIEGAGVDCDLLSKFSNLKELLIANNPNLNPELLRDILSNLPKLQKFSCHSILAEENEQNEMIDTIVEYGANLKDLKLVGFDCLQGNCFQRLVKGLGTLQALRLYHCCGDDGSFENDLKNSAEHLGNIKELVIEHQDFPAGAFIDIAGSLKNLEVLVVINPNLSNRRITGNFLRNVKKLVKLRVLRLEGAYVDGKDFHALGDIADCSKLRELAFGLWGMCLQDNNRKMVVKALKQFVQALPELKVFAMALSGISAEDPIDTPCGCLDGDCNCPNFCWNMPNEVVEQIVNMRGLESVSFGTTTRVSKETIEKLKNLKNLKTLWIRFPAERLVANLLKSLPENLGVLTVGLHNSRLCFCGFKKKFSKYFLTGLKQCRLFGLRQKSCCWPRPDIFDPPTPGNNTDPVVNYPGQEDSDF